ncbi:red chlorophyll catabolite reductase, chloroplastic [Impatiens glandulifera]|uniref:red chlorophyll catabolite reductase, chloroplastic n=1 Tax=Impatiens glandulifera TaxID=253017 RepID=UPI001FB11B28|nr:red chlorophyll catabolite reductase, chloroplastic [Impatiens glandulifera]
MAIITVQSFYLLPSTSCFRFSNSPAPSSLSTHRFKPTPIRCLASANPPPLQMNSSDDAERKRFMEFPYASSSVRDLMVDLFSTVEERLKSELLPCSLPNDVRYFTNQSGTAQNSLYIRSANKPSKVEFILGNWLHSNLPSGGSLNITSLSCYLSTATDAPNFLIELIQSSPDSLILILDVPPRKDLVLHPEYLQIYYEETQTDKHRQLLLKVPEIQPYNSSSLYIRSVVSPTAVLISVQTGVDGEGRMEEIVKENVTPAAKELLALWLDKCVCGGDRVAEVDMETLAARDRMVRRKSIEIDLGSAFPKLFGEEVASRVLDVMRVAFGV